jgi:hypothetical protein
MENDYIPLEGLGILVLEVLVTAAIMVPIPMKRFLHPVVANRSRRSGLDSTRPGT